MIIDLQRFIDAEQPFWTELGAVLDRLEADLGSRLSLAEARRFHYLYERASADLVRVTTFAAAPELREYLESLVGRAYGEIQETRGVSERLSPRRWLLERFPAVFRRQVKAFVLSSVITLVGAVFGALALSLDPGAKAVLMPFEHLQGDPGERVRQEEHARADRLSGHAASFSAMLMTHNIRVSILALALGMTFGVGTVLLLFYNGVILGAVAADYVLAGQGRFVAAWLLPHGAIEIPAVLIAGQAGLVLAGALIGRGERAPLPARMRRVGPDVLTLLMGVAMLLVWAGVVEAFLSQYHEPVLPYAAKIVFGLVELILLTLFLTWSGTGSALPEEEVPWRHGRPSTS